MKNKKQVGKALGKVPSGLFIVTTAYKDQEDAVLASWVNQTSFNPPAVTIALAITRSARLQIEASNAFIINILGKESSALMKHFFQPPKPGTSIFKGLKVKKGFQEIKVLNECIGYLECKVINQTIAGDHVVYVGEIVGGNILKGGDPYVHIRDNGFNY